MGDIADSILERIGERCEYCGRCDECDDDCETFFMSEDESEEDQDG